MDDTARVNPPRQRISASTLVVVGLLLMGCAVRFAVHDELASSYGFYYYPPPISDMAIHIGLAKEVAAGRSPQPVMYTNPGYYHLLALVFRLGGGQEWMLLLQMLLGAGIGPLLFLALRRAGLGFAASAAAGCLLALNQSLVFHEQFLLLEPLHTVCFSALIAVLLAIPPSLFQGVLTVTLVGFLHLLRPNIVVFWPAVLWWLRKRGASAATLVLMSGGALFFLLPVPFLTWSSTGTLVFGTQNLGDNFFIGNHSDANGTFQIGKAFQRVKQEAAALPAEQRTAHWLKETIRSWESPAGWLRLTMRKLCLVWGAWELPSNVSLKAMESYSPALASPLLIRFGLLGPLGLVGIGLLALGRPARLRDLGLFLAISAVLLTLMIAAFFVLGRYRLPLAVILSIGAGHALTLLVTDSRVRWRILAAALVAAYLVNGPLNAFTWPEIAPYGFPPSLRY
ncbi:MAG TPA: hypothetical protein PLU72_11850 [Candidatus Ozemobacteraceae bacterium]|nr:hypothetical protein [Candidatus Ozemobacteraceae bacterium]HQG28486.1 hypothetical protein [Candidatus Ozemobacteraceae bacterium]